jgi:hypothetical protein
MNTNKNTKNITTLHLFHRFEKQPKPLHLIHDTETDKMYFQHQVTYKHQTLNTIFTLTPYLIGYIRCLRDISFTVAKRLIIEAINKDLECSNNFDKRSNLYDVLVNKFGISVHYFRNFTSI